MEASAAAWLKLVSIRCPVGDGDRTIDSRSSIEGRATPDDDQAKSKARDKGKSKKLVQRGWPFVTEK